jgi:hypothetical protein
MANTYTSLKISYDSAFRFKKEFESQTQSSVKYLFIGNSNQYANSDTTIPDITDTVSDEKSVWDTMYAAKLITSNDVELVIPRVTWTANTKYRQFDDQIDIEDLITANTSANLKPMYVMTSNYDVYKCLCNNVSANSTVEPTGDYASSNGFISTADNYLWKYMYSIYPSNKFLTANWMPVPYSYRINEYNSNIINIVDGALAKIVTTNNGTGYYEINVSATAFSSGATTITLSSLTNVAANMYVTGTGIDPETYITSISVPSQSITLSTPTTGAGGGTGNNVSFSTRIYINGDGNDDVIASANVSNGQIQKITVTTVGTGYTKANVFIYGTGSNAAARAVFPPKYGHGFNPARDLSAYHVLISKKIGEIDSTEGGLISSNTSFRQYGLLANPHSYGNTTYSIPRSEANTVISQTFNVDLTPGTQYTLNEYVYQGTSLANSSFSGIVHYEDYANNRVRMINTRGSLEVGGILIGNTSSTIRAVTVLENPEFEPYSGDILYVNNVSKIERTDGQAENLKFVLRF